MTTVEHVRCPGEYGGGCEAVLPIDAEFCWDCGRMFHGEELLELLLWETGYMEAEVSTIE